MKNAPHTVDVFTCGEVLASIYDDLSRVNHEEAQKSFEVWMSKHDALFYPGCLSDEKAVCKAILCAITEGVSIVVMSDVHPDSHDHKEGHEGTELS